MKNQLFLLFLLTSSLTFSQKVKGKIIDALTKEPIEKAHVILGNKVVFSNAKGEFSFYKTNNQKQEFLVSHIKYKSQTVSFNKGKFITVKLIEKQEKLNEVTISKARKLKEKLSFKELPSMPKAVYSFASVLVDDTIYVFGGNVSNEVKTAQKAMQENYSGTMGEFLRNIRKYGSYYGASKDVYTYNLATQKWTKEEDLEVTKRANHEAIFYDNKIYLLGGKFFSKNKYFQRLDNKIEIIDIATKKVEIDNTNPHQAVDFSANVYQDKLIISGGSIREKKKSDEREFTNKVHVYDLTTGLWYEIGKMPVGKENTSILVGNTIYFFGGYNNEKDNTITTFNMNSGKWKKLGNLPNYLEKPALTRTKNNIFIFENNKLFLYDLKEKTLKEYSIDLNLIATKTYVHNNKLYILGGYTQDEFDRTPKKGFYAVNLNDFKNTQPKSITTY